jgi:hypothetical protein
MMRFLSMFLSLWWACTLPERGELQHPLSSISIEAGTVDIPRLKNSFRLTTPLVRREPE